MPGWAELGYFSTGDVIASGWANEIADNFDWLNARSGGDPGQSGFFLASTAGTTGQWRYLIGADYRTATIPDTAFVNQKINAFTLIVPTFGGATIGQHKNGHFQVYPASDAAPGLVPNRNYYLIQTVEATNPQLYASQIAIDRDLENEVYIRLIVNSSPTPWRRLWHVGNAGDPVTYVRNNGAQSMAGGLTISPGGLDVYGPGTLRAGLSIIAGGLAVGGGSVNVTGGDLNMGTTRRLSFPQEYGRKILLTPDGGFVIDVRATAELSIGTPQFVVFHNANAGAGDNAFEFDTNNRTALFKGALTVPSLAGGVTTQFAPYTHTHDTSGGGGTLPAHVHTGDNLVPASVATATVTASGQLVSHAGAGTPPLVVDSGTLVANLNVARVGGKTADELLSGGASPFTAGMMMYLDGGTPPPGWSFAPSAFQGKFLVCAGGTFAVGGNGGGTQHDHPTITLTHSGGAVGAASGATPQVNEVTPGTRTSIDTHGHAFTQPGNHSVDFTEANHLPPYVAVNMIRKN